MAQISIEIPVTWGTYIRELMEAIRMQSFQDYEISVSMSFKNGELEDLLKQCGAQVTICGPNLLEKRYAAHIPCRSKYSLLLDETRIPNKALLERLSFRTEDMVVIGEMDLGDSFWVRISNLDKINSVQCNPLDMNAGYVLPRYFKSSLLTQSFQNIRKNIDEQIFNQVLMEDHQLISKEAFLLSDSIGIINDNLILHHGDETLTSILRKYHKYGKSHRILKNTYYEYLLSTRKRIRKVCKGNLLKLYLFYAARGLPFIVGYYLL